MKTAELRRVDTVEPDYVVAPICASQLARVTGGFDVKACANNVGEGTRLAGPGLVAGGVLKMMGGNRSVLSITGFSAVVGMGMGFVNGVYEGNCSPKLS